MMLVIVIFFHTIQKQAFRDLAENSDIITRGLNKQQLKLRQFEIFTMDDVWKL